MTKNMLRISSAIVSVAALLTLAACGGGGGGSSTSMPGGTPGGGTPGGGTPGGGMPTLMPATGLTSSAATATPEYATSSGDTLAARLPTASNEFAPLSSLLTRDFNQPQSATIEDNAHIKTISSDGANGFSVTYVIGETEETVHFAASDYSAGGYEKEADGKRYTLRSYTGSLDGAEKNRGSNEFRYFDANGVFARIDRVSRTNFVTYGLRTDADALPAGSAHYSGRVRGDIYGSDAPGGADRTRVWASFRLTVDFAAGSLDGDIRRFQMEEPGQSRVTLPLTVYADITDGEIANGQFTATWTQVVPDLDAGEIFSGDMLGEFYGPKAEEVGGVFNGTTDDEVFAGWFGGERPTPSVPPGDLVTSAAGSHQDLANLATTHSDGAVTAIAGDGADGFSLTYTIGSDTHEVELGADDFGGNPRFRRVYSERMGDRSFLLGDVVDRFPGSPEFDHFNVNTWAVTNWSGPTSASDFHTGFVVYGTPTDASAMPTGPASYEGRMIGGRQPHDTVGTSPRNRMRGDLTLNANFDAGTVGGRIDGLEFAPWLGGSWQPVTTTTHLSLDGAISGNAFAGDVTASTLTGGEMEGHFFGPDAAEVGGTFQGTSTRDNAIVWGAFGGDKQ